MIRAWWKRRQLVNHMYKRQIVPQLKAEALRKEGYNVQVPFVYTGSEQKEGWTTVTCSGCGRTAQLPPSVEVDPSLVPLCARCVS